MKHALTISAFGIRLRPVTEADAEFIIHLRGLPHVRGTVGDTVPTVEAQVEWIREYLERLGDLYFIVETLSGIPVGTIGIYSIEERSAEWGRWIVLPDVPAGIPSALLIHDLAFNLRDLETLYGCVVASNKPVLSFHRRFGSTQVKVVPRARLIRGEWVDLVYFAVSRTDWAGIRKRMVALAITAEHHITIGQ